MALVLLISFTMSSLLGGLNTRWSTAIMSSPITQKSTNITATQNSASSAELDKEIELAEARSHSDEANVDKANRWTIVALIAYGALALLIGLMSIWSNRSNKMWNTSQELLNGMKMTKVKLDAESRLQVEMEKARIEGENKL